ncbi:hypothetical protein ACNFBT_24460 [Pseudomonas sp. NY15181]|uniref:hypothetical protein n=1 Tax=Pseudomonas sp. NY15181 TaxID=3400349 RepID=UPI003A838469
MTNTTLSSTLYLTYAARGNEHSERYVLQRAFDERQEEIARMKRASLMPAPASATHRGERGTLAEKLALISS